MRGHSPPLNHQGHSSASGFATATACTCQHNRDGQHPCHGCSTCALAPLKNATRPCKVVYTHRYTKPDPRVITTQQQRRQHALSSCSKDSVHPFACGRHSRTRATHGRSIKPRLGQKTEMLIHPIGAAAASRRESQGWQLQAADMQEWGQSKLPRASCCGGPSCHATAPAAAATEGSRQGLLRTDRHQPAPIQLSQHTEVQNPLSLTPQT